MGFCMLLLILRVKIFIIFMLIDDEIINVMSFNFDMLDFNNVDVFR